MWGHIKLLGYWETQKYQSSIKEVSNLSPVKYFVFLFFFFNGVEKETNKKHHILKYKWSTIISKSVKKKKKIGKKSLKPVNLLRINLCQF